MEHSSSPMGLEPPPIPMEGRAAEGCDTGIPQSPPLDGEQPLLPSATSLPPNTTKDNPDEITPFPENEL